MIKRILFKAKRQILKDAYQRADEIIYVAELKAKKMTYESEIMKRIKFEAEKIKRETIAECRRLKTKNL